MQFVGLYSMSYIASKAKVCFLTIRIDHLDWGFILVEGVEGVDVDRIPSKSPLSSQSDLKQSSGWQLKLKQATCSDRLYLGA